MMIGTLKQALAALIMGEVLVCLGISFGLNSIMLIQVPAEEDAFLSGDQLNWTIAVTMLGALLGGLLAVPLASLLGARRFLLLVMPLHALGALAAGLGGSFVWVLLGRALMLAVVGASEGPARAYVSEIVPPKLREVFSTSLNMAICIGQVLVLVAAPWLHWQTLFLVAGCVPPAVCLCGLLFLPDSARWLLAHGHSNEDALRSILFYHPRTDAAAEVRDIQDSLVHAHEGASVWTLLLRPETLRPLLMGSGPMVLFCWCGGSALMQITPVILEPLALPLGSYQRAMIVPILGVLLYVPAFPLIDRFGRLPLLRIGGVVSTLGCAIIAAYFFLGEEPQARLGWVVLAGAVLVAIPHFCIIGPVLFTYASELLPNKTRAVGTTLIITSLSFSTFILLKVYPLMSDTIGLGGAFVVHAVMSLCQVLLATFCLIETKGLSLEQIQRLFLSRGNSALSTHAVEPASGIGLTNSVNCKTVELDVP